MKFTAERSSLSDALKIVSRSLTIRSSVGQLAGLVSITTSATSLNLLTTDLDTATSCTIAISSGEEGSCVVASRLLSDIINSLPDGAVSLTVENTTLVISSGESKFHLRTMDSDEFPPISFPTGDTIQLPRSDLGKCLRQVLKAASRDDARPILTSVSINKMDGGLRFISTDSYRLAFAELACNNTDIWTGDEILIPARVLNDIVRYTSQSSGLSPSSDTIDLFISDNDAVITFDDVKVFSRLIDGTFPSFESVTKQSYTNTVTVAKAPLSEALKRVGLLARDSATKVTIECSDGRIILRVHAPQLGDAEEVLSAKYVGDEATSIGFNPSFLLDGIEVLSGDNIKIQFCDDKAAALISSDDDPTFQYYLMPIRMKS
ncbi:MAG: DNA polymerase III subunit beta [Acidimicrobiales bacterium]